MLWLRTSYGELGAGAGVIWGCRRGLSGDLDRVGGTSGDLRETPFFWCCGIGFGGGQLENLLTSNATAPKKKRPIEPSVLKVMWEWGWGARELGSWELGAGRW